MGEQRQAALRADWPGVTASPASTQRLGSAPSAPAATGAGGGNVNRS